MATQYQLQIFDALGRTSTLSSTFEALNVRKKNNVIGSAEIVIPSAQLIGVGYEVLQNITYSIDWTNYKNAIFVGGAGEGENRLIVQVQDDRAIGQSLWGRSEIFEASRDSEDVPALEEVGRNFLGAKRQITTFSGIPIDLPGSVFGRNYFFGDVLSFSQPNVTQVFNTPLIIQELRETGGISLLNNTIYFLKEVRIDNDSLTTTLIFHDAISLLNQRIVAFPLGTTQTTKTLPADDLIKEICRENLLSEGRQIANLTIDGDLSLAPSISVDDIAWRSVLAVCQEICQASWERGTPLYFDIIADINLNLRLKTFVGQRGIDRAGIIGIDSPYRLMINYAELSAQDGRADWKIEYLQLNGDELSKKESEITTTNNAKEIDSRSARSGGDDPFANFIIDDDGNFIIDDDGDFVVDDDFTP